MPEPIKIALIGAGPSGLFMFKKLIESPIPLAQITIFEKSDRVGAGMPYSKAGALEEHITNVSANEIPELVTTIGEWIQTVEQGTLKSYGVDLDNFNDYKVLPRLLFGDYLHAQFRLLQEKAREKEIPYKLHLGSKVNDIKQHKESGKIELQTADHSYSFDRVIVCSGHSWPIKHEGTIPRYFDSPYPPAKLKIHANHPVAIKGASLTAIDALRTLSRQHGEFSRKEDGLMRYTLYKESSDFRLVMHSRNGMLPAVRFHLDDSMLGNGKLLSPEDIKANREQNDGFLSLDYIFEENFKKLLKEKQPVFYESVRDLGMEEFVERMMNVRENMDAFELLKKEYAAAQQSIQKQESIYWKELLAVLSFSMNYPAKYFSAEDMLRLQSTLMPLISLVIAFVPQSSAQEMMALFEAGVLSLETVGDDGTVEPHQEGGITYQYRDPAGRDQAIRYLTYVDATGQPHLAFEDFPYKSLMDQQIVSPGRLRFRDNTHAEQLLKKGQHLISKGETGNYYLRVPGIAINDHFQVVDDYGALHPQLFIMAVSLMSGYNPDYSGLDFCEAASTSIVKQLI